MKLEISKSRVKQQNVSVIGLFSLAGRHEKMDDVFVYHECQSTSWSHSTKNKNKQKLNQKQRLDVPFTMFVRFFICLSCMFCLLVRFFMCLSYTFCLVACLLLCLFFDVPFPYVLSTCSFACFANAFPIRSD